MAVYLWEDSLLKNGFFYSNPLALNGSLTIGLYP